MALTINQVKNERRKYVQELKRLMRAVDSAVESAQRLIDQVLRRKNKIPEVADLKQLAERANKIIQALAGFDKELGKGYVE